MKNIYLLRHSTKVTVGDSALSREGLELAKNVGLTKLLGKQFTHLYVSPLSRSIDTLKALAEGAGDFPKQEPSIFPPHSVSITLDGMALWEGVCHEAEKAGQDMMRAAMTKDKDRAEKIASKGGAAFKEWLASIPDGSNVLVVHHSPFLELIAYNLFGEVLRQLQPCEGFRVIEENGVLTLLVDL